jgi:hypothetical protein
MGEMAWSEAQRLGRNKGGFTRTGRMESGSRLLSIDAGRVTIGKTTQNNLPQQLT